MERVDHNNVIRIRDYFEDDEYICMVMDLMVGDMTDLLLVEAVALPEPDAKFIFH